MPVNNSTNNSASELTISGTTTVNKILDEDLMTSDDPQALATQQSIKAYVDAQVVGSNIPPFYTKGLTLQNDAGDTDHDITINIGIARKGNTNNVFDFTSPFTKQLDAVWVAGTGNGGRASSVALSTSTWYHVFVLSTAGGVVDAGFDTSITATNLLADTGAYNQFMRVGSVLTDGSSNIIQFKQRENHHVVWDTPVNFHSAPISPTAASVTPNTPVDVITKAEIYAYVVDTASGSTTAMVYLSALDQPDIAPSVTAVGTVLVCDSGAVGCVGAQAEVYTDTSSSFRIRGFVTTSGTIDLSCLGYVDSINQ